MACVSGKSEQAGCLNVVLQHTATLFVHFAELDERPRMTLVSGEPEQADCLSPHASVIGSTAQFEQLLAFATLDVRESTCDEPSVGPRRE